MGKYIKTFDFHTAYMEYSADTESYVKPNVSYCKDNNEVHYNIPNPCESKIIDTTYDYVEIGGLKWATKNVGALTETDLGQFFQWGDVSGYTADQISGSCHSKLFASDFSDYKFAASTGSSTDITFTKYNTIDQKTTLDLEDDAARYNMGGSWRMPTRDECLALGEAVTTAWTTDYQGSGVAGCVLTDKTDSSKKLFLPSSYIWRDGNATAASFWWQSTVAPISQGAPYNRAYNLTANSGATDFGINNNWRLWGFNVRGVMDL